MTHRTGWMMAASLTAALSPAVARAADYMGDAARLAATGNLPAARLQLRNAVKADDANAAAHYQLGMVDLQLGDAAAAEKEGRSAQDAGYDAAATLSLLTSAYLSQGHYRELLRDFPVGQGDPAASAAVLVSRGRAQLALGHADQAGDSFANARRLAPLSAEPLVAEAQLAAAAKDSATARQKLADALRIDPNSAEALLQQSDLLARQGDQAGAVAAADKAVDAAPGQAFFRLNRAGLLIGFGQADAARADVDAVQAATPNNARAAYYRAILKMSAGDYAGANADLDKLSRFVSQNPAAYLVLATVKQKMGQAEQALDAATRYVARTPADPAGALLLARLQMEAKRPEKAVEALTPLADGGSADPNVYAQRADAFNQLGRPQDALKDYQKALTLRPDNPRLLSDIGAMQLALHQADQAAASLARSSSLAPGQRDTETLLATALLDAGHLDEAQKAIDRLQAQGGGGNDGMPGMLGGGVALARFNLPAAQQAFEAVLRDHPDSVPARLSLAHVALLQGRLDDWARMTGDVLQREPAREQVVDDVMEQFLQQGKPADAIGVLQRAHAAAPANPRFTDRLASLYLALNQPQNALDLVSQPSPDPATALRSLIKAQAQVALKQPDAAQATYRQILANDPTVTFARLQLARLLIATKNAADAQIVLQDGLAADPQNEALLQMSATADAKGADLAAAVASAARLEKDPTHQPASLGLRGDLYMSAKQYNDAAKAYAESMKTAPSARLALRLAFARNAGGQVDQAIQGLRGWLAQHPGDLDVVQAMSDLEISARQFDAAKPLLADLVAKQPNNAKALNNLAYVYQQTRTPRAAALAQRAYQLAPTPQAADTWGYILATDGGDDHGVALLRQATMQVPNDPAMKYHLAVAYRAAGQPGEAVKVLAPLVAAPADFGEKPQARQLLASLSGKP